MRDFDLVIIGAGPAGYVAAIRAAQLGMKTAVVERERAGGVCLNWGCIPTKALLKSAEVLDLFKKAKTYGVLVSEAKADVKAMVAHSRKVVDQLAKGVEGLLRKNKVEQIVGTARMLKPTTVHVTLPDGKTRTIEAKKVILATGGRARLIPGLEADGKRVLTAKEAMLLEQAPKHAIVIGGGAIGCEFATFWSSVGSKVTIVEMLPRILPLEDEDVSSEVEKQFKARGIDCLTGTAFKSAKVHANGVTVEVAKKDGPSQTLEGDIVLAAIGVRGNVENLGLEDLKVQTERSFIKVGKDFQTSAPGLYAVGDVIGGALLAHKGSAEGIACVELIAGKGDGHVAYDQIPGGTFCTPQVGSIGLTEKAAREKGLDVKIGKFPFRALGRAIAVGEDEGFVKVVVGAKRGEILGCHVVGHGAVDLIAEVSVAMKSEATVHELHDAIHAHPTMPEAIMEAAAAAMGRAIHI